MPNFYAKKTSQKLGLQCCANFQLLWELPPLLKVDKKYIKPFVVHSSLAVSATFSIDVFRRVLHDAANSTTFLRREHRTQLLQLYPQLTYQLHSQLLAEQLWSHHSLGYLRSKAQARHFWPGFCFCFGLVLTLSFCCWLVALEWHQVEQLGHYFLKFNFRMVRTLPRLYWSFYYLFILFIYLFF